MYELGFLPISGSAIDTSSLGFGLGLRSVSEVDKSFLLKLSREYQEGVGLSGATVAQSDMKLRSQFEMQNRHYEDHYGQADYWIVTQAGGGPIGRLYLDRSQKLWRLLDMQLLQLVRGRGYGRAILEWVQAQARAAQAAGVELNVLASDRRGEALFVAAGFKLVRDGMHRHMVWET